jgi:hypothetical protein
MLQKLKTSILLVSKNEHFYSILIKSQVRATLKTQKW